jgi:hypothetical protein
MIVELLGALAALDPAAAAAAAPAADASGFGEAFEFAKLIGGGGAATFALLAWQALRTERAARMAERKSEVEVRADRQRELDARLERIATVLARVEERTRNLIGPGDVAAGPAPRGARARTPVHGVRVAARKPTESDP